MGPRREGGSGLGDSSRDLQLRVAGAACALVAAGIHLALAFSDLIPGESTRGPAFALMGLGFAACAVVLFFRKLELDMLVLVYVAGLVLAYVGTRDERPVEAIGLSSKAVESILLVIVAILLARRRASKLPNERGSTRS